MNFEIAKNHSPALQGRGIFIVIEGIDGSGKSTQVKLLRHQIAKSLGEEVQLAPEMVQPTHSGFGSMIRTFASKSQARMPLYEFSLFLLDRQEQAKEVRRQVQEGRVVTMDRCYHSSVAYQSSGEEGAMSREQVYMANRLVFPKPDLLIFIDVNVDEALSRCRAAGKAPEIFETRSYLEQAMKNYRWIMDREKALIVDGMMPKEDVAQIIFGLFNGFRKGFSRY